MNINIDTNTSFFETLTIGDVFSLPVSNSDEVEIFIRVPYIMSIEHKKYNAYNLTNNYYEFFPASAEIICCPDAEINISF